MTYERLVGIKNTGVDACYNLVTKDKQEIVCKEFFEALHHEQQALVGVLGLEDHLALALHLFLVGAHQAVAGRWRLDLRSVGGRRAQLLAFFNETFGLNDLAAFELAVFIGLLQQVAEVRSATFATTFAIYVLWVIGTGSGNL